MTLGVIVEGDREIADKFDRFPRQSHAALVAAITGETDSLKAAILAGVPRRTGRLASEIVSSVRDGRDRIVGAVSVSGEFAKAAALEYGAHAKTRVRAHVMRLDHLWARAAAAPLTVDVPAYTRTPDIAEHRFLRGPFAAQESRIVKALDDAVEGVSKDL